MDPRRSFLAREIDKDNTLARKIISTRNVYTSQVAPFSLGNVPSHEVTPSRQKPTETDLLA